MKEEAKASYVSDALICQLPRPSSSQIAGI